MEAPVEAEQLDMHLREFLFSQLRSGSVCKNNFVIKPPKYSIVSEAYFIYKECYEKFVNEGIMTLKEINEWMINRDLWSKDLDSLLIEKQKLVEDVKFDIYKNRSNKKKVNEGILKVKFIEKEIKKLNDTKNSFYDQTCEFLADDTRINFVLKHSSFYKNKRIKPCALDRVKSIYYSSFLDEYTLRFIAIKDPWLTLWLTSCKSNLKLFCNKEDEDLTINQKNIMSWSYTFDQLRNSHEPPPKECWENHYVMDGFLIHLNRQEKTSNSKNNIDSHIRSSKIKNASTRIIFPQENISVDDINNSNDESAKKIIQDRENQFKSGGVKSFSDFNDIKGQDEIKKMNAIKKAYK